MVITAVLLAAKFYDDSYYNNAYYAKVGGVPVAEMNGLELEFLFFVQFSLHVTPDVFMKYRNELVSHTSWTSPDKALIHPINYPSSRTMFSSSSTRHSNPTTELMSTREQQHVMMQVTSNQENTWTHVTQISPSPPPSATSVSPPSCDDQDKTEALLNIEHLKYYSAPARYSCLPPESLNQSRHRSNSFPIVPEMNPHSNLIMDRIPSQQHFVPMETYTRVVSEDHFVHYDNTMMASRPRSDMVRTTSHERCLSVPISPNSSSPRYVDAIVFSKS